VLEVVAEQSCCATEAVTAPILAARNLSVSIAGRAILRNVNLSIQPRQVFGVIGPSGAGKSTLLKCFNRLIDLTPHSRMTGDILFHDQSILTGKLHPDDLRTRIGMLFQQPVVFPKSIYENTIFGMKRLRLVTKRELPAVAEAALREAALWDEVKDRLHDSALKLSVGQQQRLCLARALSMRPEIILMDEPTSALDPRSTEAIEQLMTNLKQRHTIVLVTHNIAQARRVCDWLACVCVNDGVGEVAETACCDQMLDNPCCQAVVEYLKTN
jgi:phosphate transport system ATP-binding protein